MKKRNYGIDLLRIVATFMIIVLHILGAGGALRAASPDSVNYKIVWLLECAAYCAVNCYALISGYVGIHSKFRISNIVKLWLQVAFYSVIIYCIGSIWFENITWITIVKAFFPVMTKEYWYFSAYVCMYLLMPFLNMILESIDKNMAKWLVLVCVILFMCMPIITQKDIFFINNGYSAAWLVILYLFGGIIRKYEAEISVKKWLLLGGYVVGVFLTFLSHMVELPFFAQGFLMNYNSPTMVVAATCLVLLFKDMEAKKLTGIIKRFAPVTFGIYLIHVHTVVFDYVLPSKFIWLVEKNPLVLIVAVIVAAFLIFIGCAVLEFARMKLFGLKREKV